MIRYEKEIFLYLPVEREGEGQENGGRREGKTEKGKENGGKRQGKSLPLDTPSEYLLIPIRMICKIPVYNPKRSLIIIPHIPIGKYS